MTKNYLAIGAYSGMPITNNKSLEYVKLPLTKPVGHDILVRIKAISVNPIDTKLRRKLQAQGTVKVFGYDAVSEVVAVGEAVTKFKVGDRVFYVGDALRAGSNAQYQLVREEIVALAPNSLDDAQAAALPLTMLTAYELLFEKLGLTPQKDAHVGKTLLVINGSGGVGASVIQLANWLGMTIIATASRPETKVFVESLGADFVVNHYQDYVTEIHKLGFKTIDNIVVLNATDYHFEKVAQLITPFGHIGAIVDSKSSLPMNVLKPKSVSFDWEFVFAKTQNNYNVASQGKYLQIIAELIDQRILKTTIKQKLDGINLVNLKKAHKLIEDGHVIGKIVLCGKFE